MNAAEPATLNRRPRKRQPAADNPAFVEALLCGSRGLRVFPLYGIYEGNCDCRKLQCASPGKHPRIRNYHKEATADLAAINAWGTKWPESNWGMIPAHNDLVVIDIDPRNGGHETAQKLVEKHGPFPRTPLSHTGGDGGGTHAYYQRPAGYRVKGVLGPGIEAIVNKPVVLPGSLHMSGRRYKWDERASLAVLPVAPLPKWMFELLCERETEDPSVTESTEKTERNLSPSSVPSVHSVTTGTPADQDCDSDAITRAIASTIPSSHGRRHRAIFSFARNLKAIPEWANANLTDLKPLLRRWHAAALANIRTKDFTTSWADFCAHWPNVKYPTGEGEFADALAAADAASEPSEIEQYDCDRTRRLVRLCRELQRRVEPGKPFYLSCEVVYRTFGFGSKMTASRVLKMLRADGVLAVAEAHTETRATRYRYLLPL